MKKNFHLLGGLPRSGNTLLSALLNQHPDIHSSTLSPLSTFLWNIENTLKHENVQRNQINIDRSINLQKNIGEIYYSDVNKPIIFDREKDWGLPLNIKIAQKYLNPDIKIVMTVRDILDIMSSLYSLAGNIYLNNAKNSDTVQYFGYMSNEEVFCEFINRPDSNLKRSMFALSCLINSEYPEMVHIVEYEDLVNNTQFTMDSIYNFIGVKGFKNNTSNIVKNELDEDEGVGWPSNTHDIHKIIKKSNTDPKNVFNKKIIDKYSGMEFWRK